MQVTKNPGGSTTDSGVDSLTPFSIHPHKDVRKKHSSLHFIKQTLCKELVVITPISECMLPIYTIIYFMANMYLNELKSVDKPAW